MILARCPVIALELPGAPRLDSHPTKLLGICTGHVNGRAICALPLLDENGGGVGRCAGLFPPLGLPIASCDRRRGFNAGRSGVDGRRGGGTHRCTRGRGRTWRGRSGTVRRRVRVGVLVRDKGGAGGVGIRRGDGEDHVIGDSCAGLLRGEAGRGVGARACHPSRSRRRGHLDVARWSRRARSGSRQLSAATPPTSRARAAACARGGSRR